MAIVYSEKEKLDRTKVTVHLYDFQYKEALQILYPLRKALDPKNTLYWKKGYLRGLMLKQGLQSIAQVIVGSTPQKHRYISWELWPSAINSPEHQLALSELEEIFDAIVGGAGSIYSLYHAQNHGKISYLEIARDFVGVENESILPWSMYSRREKIFKNHDKGTNETIYLGSRGSARQFVIYDKRLQLIAKGLPCAYPSLLRVEVRLKNLGILVKDIGHLPDQFKNLYIANLLKARVLSNAADWQSFIQIVENSGAVSAFSTLTKYHRKTYREQLIKCGAHWWN